MKYLFQNLICQSFYLNAEVSFFYQKKPQYKFLEKNKSATSSLCLRLDEYSESTKYQSHNNDLKLVKSIDIIHHLELNSTVIFTVRVNTHLLGSLGLFKGDLLIIDQNTKPIHGKIVVGYFNDELCIRRLHIDSKRIYLSYGETSEKDIILNENYKLEILGIVKHIIHAL